MEFTSDVELPFTHGIETELQLVDRETGAILRGETLIASWEEMFSRAAQSLAALEKKAPKFIKNKIHGISVKEKSRHGKLIKYVVIEYALGKKRRIEVDAFGPDPNISQITWILELVTPPCASVLELAWWLSTLMTIAIEAVPARVGIVATGFNGVEKEYQSGVTFGDHHHIGIPSEKAKIAAYNLLRNYIPHLIALSVNSPFIDGLPGGRGRILLKKRDTLKILPKNCTRSLRLKYNKGQMGPPDKDHYVPHLKKADQSFFDEVILREPPDDRYVDLFPFTAYGTIELRFFDTQFSVSRRVALALLVQALAYKATRAIKHVPGVASEVLVNSRAKAIEFGLVGKFFPDDSLPPEFARVYNLHVGTGKRNTRLYHAARAMLAFLRPELAQLGFSRFLAPIHASLHGTDIVDPPVSPADFQLYRYQSEDQDFPGLMKTLLADTEAFARDPDGDPLIKTFGPPRLETATADSGPSKSTTSSPTSGAAAIPGDGMACPICEEVIPSTSNFCLYCGLPMPMAPDSTPAGAKAGRMSQASPTARPTPAPTPAPPPGPEITGKLEVSSRELYPGDMPDFTARVAVKHTPGRVQVLLRLIEALHGDKEETIQTAMKTVALPDGETTFTAKDLPLQFAFGVFQGKKVCHLHFEIKDAARTKVLFLEGGKIDVYGTPVVEIYEDRGFPDAFQLKESYALPFKIANETPAFAGKFKFRVLFLSPRNQTLDGIEEKVSLKKKKKTAVEVKGKFKRITTRPEGLKIRAQLLKNGKIVKEMTTPLIPVDYGQEARPKTPQVKPRARPPAGKSAVKKTPPKSRPRVKVSTSFSAPSPNISTSRSSASRSKTPPPAAPRSKAPRSKGKKTKKKRRRGKSKTQAMSSRARPSPPAPPAPRVKTPTIKTPRPKSKVKTTTPSKAKSNIQGGARPARGPTTPTPAVKKKRPRTQQKKKKKKKKQKKQKTPKPRKPQKSKKKPTRQGKPKHPKAKAQAKAQAQAKTPRPKSRTPRQRQGPPSTVRVPRKKVTPSIPRVPLGHGRKSPKFSTTFAFRHESHHVGDKIKCRVEATPLDGAQFSGPVTYKLYYVARGEKYLIDRKVVKKVKKRVKIKIKVQPGSTYPIAPQFQLGVLLLEGDLIVGEVLSDSQALTNKNPQKNIKIVDIQHLPKTTYTDQKLAPVFVVQTHQLVAEEELRFNLKVAIPDGKVLQAEVFTYEVTGTNTYHFPTPISVGALPPDVKKVEIRIAARLSNYSPSLVVYQEEKRVKMTDRQLTLTFTKIGAQDTKYPVSSKARVWCNVANSADLTYKGKLQLFFTSTSRPAIPVYKRKFFLEGNDNVQITELLQVPALMLGDQVFTLVELKVKCKETKHKFVLHEISSTPFLVEPRAPAPVEVRLETDRHDRVVHPKESLPIRVDLRKRVDLPKLDFELVERYENIREQRVAKGKVKEKDQFKVMTPRWKVGKHLGETTLSVRLYQDKLPLGPDFFEVTPLTFQIVAPPPKDKGSKRVTSSKPSKSAKREKKANKKSRIFKKKRT